MYAVETVLSEIAQATNEKISHSLCHTDEVRLLTGGEMLCSLAK